MPSYVYRLTCTHPASPQKYYYGVRSCPGDPRQDAYWSSSRYVAQARQARGAAWFTKKIVGCYPTVAAAYAKEIRLHAYFDVKTHPLFFNRSNQTSHKFSRAGVRCTPATIEKIRAQVRGRVYSPDVLAQRVHRRGETRSAQARANMSQAQQGRVCSPETRAKMAQAHTGQTHTPETKAKISAANQGRGLGRPVSAATRAKLSHQGHGRRHSAATREKARQGRVVSAETREKIAAAQRRRHQQRRPRPLPEPAVRVRSRACQAIEKVKRGL